MSQTVTYFLQSEVQLQALDSPDCCHTVASQRLWNDFKLLVSVVRTLKSYINGLDSGHHDPDDLYEDLSEIVMPVPLYLMSVELIGVSPVKVTGLEHTIGALDSLARSMLEVQEKIAEFPLKGSVEARLEHLCQVVEEVATEVGSGSAQALMDAVAIARGKKPLEKRDGHHEKGSTGGGSTEEV